MPSENPFPEPPSTSLHAAREDAGQRLDRWLQARLPQLSRTRLQALVREGRLSEDGVTIGDPAHKVKPGALYRLDVPEPAPPAPQPEHMPLAVVYEDDQLIVIDKPAGLVVHPSAGHEQGTLVNALIAHCGDSLSGIGGVRRPGIVHRLDKDTSGLLVVAKTDAAHRSLAAQFAAHGRDGRMHRAYLALVWGEPLPRVGRVEAALGRKPTNRLKMAVVRDEEGRAAATRYEVLETFAGEDGRPLASLVRCTLETGRTHQIRVHMAHLGHPLLGDATYGKGFVTSVPRLPGSAQQALAHLGRQALHAAELGIEHPRTGKPLHFASDLPGEMADLLAALRPSKPPARRRPGKR